MLNKSHLAAKFGTRDAASYEMSSLLWLIHSLGWCYCACSFLVSAISSYVDDIACTKILMKAALDCHALHRGRGGCVTFSFKAVRRFYHF